MKQLRLLLIPFLLLTMGCSDPYGACVKAGTDIFAGIGQGMKTVDEVRKQGLITPDEESNVLGFLKFANDADKAFLDCASKVHTNGSSAGSYTSCAQIFNKALNTPQETALIHVSNPSAQNTINNAVQVVALGVNTIIVLLGGA